MTALYKQKLPRRPCKDFHQAFVRYIGAAHRRTSQLPLKPGAFGSLRGWATYRSFVYIWPTNRGAYLECKWMSCRDNSVFDWCIWSFWPENASIIEGLCGHWCDLGSADCMLGSKMRAYIFVFNKSTQHITHWFLRLVKSQQCQVGQRPWALSPEPGGEAGSTAGLAALLPQAWKCGFRHQGEASLLELWDCSDGYDSESFPLQLLKVAESQ